MALCLKGSALKGVGLVAEKRISKKVACDIVPVNRLGGAGRARPILRQPQPMRTAV